MGIGDSETGLLPTAITRIERKALLASESAPRIGQFTSVDRPSRKPGIIPPPETLSKPVYTAVFTKGIAESLTRCGISIDYVNPVPLGAGANHTVYRWAEPGQVERVVKLANPLSLATITFGKDEEQSNLETAKKHFTSYSAATEVRVDPQNPKFFCVVQELVQGEILSSKAVKDNPKLKEQIADIIRCNRELFAQENMSLDFIGGSGFISWIKSQFVRILRRRSEFQVSNIIINPEGKLRIIDFEYFKFKDHVPLGKRFVNFVAFSTNRILMKHYFGLDIKK